MHYNDASECPVWWRDVTARYFLVKWPFAVDQRNVHVRNIFISQRLQLATDDN